MIDHLNRIFRNRPVVCRACNAHFTESELKELHDGTGEAIVCPACGSVNLDYIGGK